MTTTYQLAPVLPAEILHEDTDTLFSREELDAYERHRTRSIQKRHWIRKLGWAEIATWLLCVLPVLVGCVYCGAHYSITHNIYIVRVVHAPPVVRIVTHWKLESGGIVTTVSAPRPDVTPVPHMDRREKRIFDRAHTSHRLS